MSEIESGPLGTDYLTTLPKTAIQAIYHAVTGKTENMSKWLHGNVVITFNDVERLYAMLKDQWHLHPLLADPTTTIVISDENDRRLRYSSWERFSKLQTSGVEITSDVTIRCELVTELPNTGTPQRCVINVTLDSGLPLISESQKDRLDTAPPSFLFFMRQDWRTVQLSIDFVDFILAKSFAGLIEEWFKTLQKTPSSKWAFTLARASRLLGAISSQFGRIGAAVFIFSYILFIEKRPQSIRELVLAGASCLFVWALVQIFATKLVTDVRRRSIESIIPSAILLTDGDNGAFDKIKENVKTASGTFARLLAGAMFAIALNVVASYVFVWVHH